MKPNVYSGEASRPIEAASRLYPKASAEAAEWIDDNINSIREGVADGAHDAIYYPASGSDVVRPLLSYDATSLVCVETDEQFFGDTLRQLQEVGAEEIQTEEIGQGRRLDFTLDGKKRQITEVVGDARFLTPQKLGVSQVDVLHVYAPTGAVYVREDEAYLRERFDDDWESETARAALQDADAPKPDEWGEYKLVARGAGETVNADNYPWVRENGYFAFNERTLPWQPELFEIAGLEEVPITRRHPLTVSTSFYPTDEQIAAMDRTGYLLHKVRTVEPEVITLCNEAPSTRMMVEALAAGDFSMLGINTGDEKIDVAHSLRTHYATFVARIHEQAERFQGARVDQELVARYEASALQDYADRVRALQSGVTAMYGALKDLSRGAGDGGLNAEIVFEALGIRREDGFGGPRLENTKYPLAYQYAFDRDMWGNPAREVVNQFMAADLGFLG